MESSSIDTDRLNHLPLDLRAEVVVADMLEDGISLDELILNPVGPFKRGFSRDISKTEWVESQQSARRWLQIDLNRAGLYDLLPEGVFHQPTTAAAPTAKEDIFRELEEQQKRELAARRFFLPVEQEFFRQRVRIEQEQRAYLLSDDTLLPDDLLGQFWALPAFLEPYQAKRLLYLLPLMHRIAGDTAAMTACFEQLLEERVSLEFDRSDREYIQADTLPLGQWQLGNNSVLDGWLADGESVWRLVVHIERPERVAAYLPDSDGLRFVEWLAGYLVPLDTGLRIDLDTSALANAFSFTQDSYLSRLDFTTTLTDV